MDNNNYNNQYNPGEQMPPNQIPPNQMPPLQQNGQQPYGASPPAYVPTPYTSPTSGYYPPPPQQQPYYAPPQQSNGKGTASLVLGIICLVSMVLGYLAFAGLICGIIGIILGAMARKEGARGAATAGLVTSCIGVGLVALVLVSCIGLFGCSTCAGCLVESWALQYTIFL